MAERPIGLRRGRPTRSSGMQWSEVAFAPLVKRGYACSTHACKATEFEHDTNELCLLADRIRCSYPIFALREQQLEPMEGETGLGESKDVDMREEDVVVPDDAAAQTTSWDGTRLLFLFVTVAPSPPRHIQKHQIQNADFLRTGCAEGEYTVRTAV